MTVLEKMDALSDFRVLRFYEHISRKLLHAANTDAATIIAKMPSEMADTDEMKAVQGASGNSFDKPLDDKTAVAFARKSLTVLAVTPAGKAFLEDELDSYRDTDMVAESILAIGGAISLVMLVANSEISYDRQNGLRIGIGTIKDKDQVQARTGMLQALLNVIPGFKKLLGAG